jgi:hypothetical protein
MCFSFYSISIFCRRLFVALYITLAVIPSTIQNSVGASIFCRRLFVALYITLAVILSTIEVLSETFLSGHFCRRLFVGLYITLAVILSTIEVLSETFRQPLYNSGSDSVKDSKFCRSLFCRGLSSQIYDFSNTILCVFFGLFYIKFCRRLFVTLYITLAVILSTIEVLSGLFCRNPF